MSSSHLKCQPASGWMPLRVAICEYTKTFRGARCTPEQVFSTAGTQQVIELTTRLILDPGDSVLFEDPGYWRARAAFLSNGASIKSCGLIAGVAKAIYVTPSHQFPLGVTMSIEGRIELLDWRSALLYYEFCK